MLKKSAIVAGIAAASMVIAPVAIAAPAKGSAMKLSLSGVTARASTPSKKGENMGGNIVWLVLAAAGLGGIIYAATKKSSP
jgi:hypothetical protein